MTNNGRPTRPNPIVGKFTRRLTRDTVLASRSNSGQLTAEVLGLPPTSMVDRILIFPHLTPRLQDPLQRRNIRMLTITNSAGLKTPESSFARQTHQE